MQIKMTLSQEDIEAAIKEYVAKTGVPPVTAVTFITKRSGGFSIAADVEISDRAAGTPVSEDLPAEANEPIAAEVPDAPKAAPKEAPKEPDPKPRAVAKAKATPKEPVAEEGPVVAKAEETPFTPDTPASNDAEMAPEANNTRSLFG